MKEILKLELYFLSNNTVTFDNKKNIIRQKTKEANDTIHTILKYGFGELNLHRIWAEIFSTAQENITLFNKIGFVREGILRQKLWRDGKWWNSHIYSILSSEFNKK